MTGALPVRQNNDVVLPRNFIGQIGVVNYGRAAQTADSGDYGTDSPDVQLQIKRTGDLTMLKPTEVKAKAQRMEDQNLKFRTFLKNRADDDELDAYFLELHNKLFSGYDCSKCNNCCRAFAIPLTAEEAPPIAAFLGLSESHFIAKYPMKVKKSESEYDDEREYDYQMKSKTCAFLDTDGKCRIQSCKPIVCRDFPHTDKPERLSSMYSVIGAAEVCPVVFEIIERLKQIYGFRRKR
jgi:Fe-S-cluster containining protein